MKLYVSPFAPNAMRVEVLALEKSIELDIVDVPTFGRDRYRDINPLVQVPALELDDGTILTESLVICRYLDETSGEPRLYGNTPESRAQIGMWDRRAEMLLFNPAVEYGHHTHPMFAQWLSQHPEWAKTLIPRAQQMVSLMADQLDQHRYIVGDEISAADFTAALGYFAFTAWGAFAPSDHPSVLAWASMMLERPSMAPWRKVLEAFKASMPEASSA